MSPVGEPPTDCPANPAGAGAGVPVVTIDGPTASGKGTVAERVAQALGFAVLDSGALYRLAALGVIRSGLDPAAPGAVAAIVGHAEAAIASGPRFAGGRVILRSGEDLTDALRAEAVGRMASQIAVIPELRTALVAAQRAFRRAPGLVADGRDMGTVIFPDAGLKVFLTASVEARANRRYKQLIDKGVSAKLTDLLDDLAARDARDTQRAAAPLAAAPDAYRLDSSNLAVEEVAGLIVDWYLRSGKQGSEKQRGGKLQGS